jgi:hypothetical protein
LGAKAKGKGWGQGRVPQQSLKAFASTAPSKEKSKLGEISQPKKILWIFWTFLPRPKKKNRNSLDFLDPPNLKDPLIFPAPEPKYPDNGCLNLSQNDKKSRYLGIAFG